MNDSRPVLLSFACVIFAAMSAFNPGCTAADGSARPAEMKLELLCRPTQDKQEAARKINTMKFFDGRLYIGHGCYAVNTGPTDIISLDPKTGAATVEGRVDDEAIFRYCDMCGMLAIPGVDATEDWSAGNCYTLEDGKWLKHRTIPNGLHIWTLVEYHGRWFIGTHSYYNFNWGPKEELNGMPGLGMILSSGDKGRNWRFEYAPANDINVDSFTQYLVVFKDRLYAFPFARTFPNVKVSLDRIGTGSTPLYDAFSGMDTLVYDGALWQAVSLISDPCVHAIRPVPVGDKLALYVIFKDYRAMYEYDGQSVRKLKYTCDRIPDFQVYDGRTYMLVVRDGKFLLAESSDPAKWKEFLLPAEIGEPLSIECHDGVLYVGTLDGGVWKGPLPE